MQKQAYDAGVYARNHQFLMELRSLMRGGYISKQEMMTFRGQALSGDKDGAIKGLAKLMASRCYE